MKAIRVDELRLKHSSNLSMKRDFIWIVANGVKTGNTLSLSLSLSLPFMVSPP